MRVSSALERRIDMWNEKHDVYGWNLNRHSEFYGSNPCKGCSNFIENFPYCKLSAIKSTGR